MAKSNGNLILILGGGAALVALALAAGGEAPARRAGPAPRPDGRGSGARASLTRLRALRAATGLPVPVLYAISVVESRGNDAAFRFEPHVFARLRLGITSRSSGGMDYATLKAQTNRDSIPYTAVDPARGKLWSGVRSETNDWSAFQRAYRVHGAYAVKATSWGRYQVLGYDLLRAYPNAETAVAAFEADPARVSDKILVAWFARNPKAKTAALDGDWRTFAHHYNGPGNVDKYAPLLTTAHAEGRHLA